MTAPREAVPLAWRCDATGNGSLWVLWWQLSMDFSGLCLPIHRAIHGWHDPRFHNGLVHRFLALSCHHCPSHREVSLTRVYAIPKLRFRLLVARVGFGWAFLRTGRNTSRKGVLAFRVALTPDTHARPVSSFRTVTRSTVQSDPSPEPS